MNQMNFIRKYIVIGFALLTLYGCGEPEQIINPTHYSRVPRPVNLQAVTDTTASGKFSVSLTWEFTSEENLKDFSLLRSARVKKSDPIVFTTLALNITQRSFVDSSYNRSLDTVYAAYYIEPRGKDSFIGQNSDTLNLTLFK